MSRSQTLVQLNDALLSALDEAAARTGQSRSQLIRAAISEYLSTVLYTDDDRAIVAGYQRHPQKTDSWSSLAAREAIAEEPW